MIIHIADTERRASILASEIKSITRIPKEHSRILNKTFEARTCVEYGDAGKVTTFTISEEEHDAIVSAWGAAIAKPARSPTSAAC